MNHKHIQFGRTIHRQKKSRILPKDFLFKSLDIFGILKKRFVNRMFWGRSNYYRNVSHIFMVSLTLIIVISGAIYKISSTSANANVTFSTSTDGLDDLLEQGGSIETVLVTNPEAGGLETLKHTVKPGETLDSIASDYNVTKDTIRWASKDVVSPFTDKIEAGWILTIPSINGVLYTVRAGQTLDQVISEASIDNDEANRFNIVQFNNLEEPYTLASGQKLFIPDGNLRDTRSGEQYDIPKGVFIDPLSDGSCAGYSYSRGYSSYHNGVDLAKWPGCTIVAVANGYVTFAGWRSQGEGYNVEIDHGGGIVTKYFHGNGEFWVKAGDRVSQGQAIMQMGTTGNSTGVHLHFSLWKNGVSIDPEGYVPYNY